MENPPLKDRRRGLDAVDRFAASGVGDDQDRRTVPCMRNPAPSR